MIKCMVKKYIFRFLILCCLISCNQDKTIQIKVGIVYKMGPQPVARTKFYLLNKQLETKYFTPPRTVEIFKGTGAASKVEPGIAEDLIKDRIVATTVTDFEGNAVFDNVPSGIYWIAGFARTRSE